MQTRGGIALVIAVASVVLLGGAGVARAQIVNVQSAIGDVPEGFSGQFDAAADWRTGNTKLLLLTGAVTVRYKQDNHLVFAVVKGEYGEVGAADTKFLEHTFEHLRYRFKLNARLTLEAYAQHEFDDFRRLQLRALVGVGPRIMLVEKPDFGLILGVSYMFEHQELNEKTDAMGVPLADSGDSFTDHRISVYLLLSAKVNDKVTFSETVYAQPKINDPGDLRLLNETALVVTLTTRLTFKTAFVLAHDSDPPDGLESTDTTLISGISLKF